MLEDLTQKLETVFQKLRGYGTLTEKNVADSMKEIRRALLEADVNYKVVKDFVSSVQDKAIGQDVLRSVTPGQMIVKIVHSELIDLLGETSTQIKIAGIPPTIVMLAGLQGCGKTTFAGKLAQFFRKKGRHPMLVAADVYRPAAIEQLKVVGKSLDIPVYSEDSGEPVKICSQAIAEARQQTCDLLILDTAGRLHIDDEMMRELEEIKEKVKPHEILFVADGMTGQDAVNSAKEFCTRLEFDGIVLTKLDGDTRGGAALSIRAVTQKPIKFIGVGEKYDAIEQFFPDRMASRILGMGDVVTLVEKAQETIDQEKAARLEKKILKQDFNLEDFFDQLQQIKKMGPLDQLLGMIPGVGSQLSGMNVDDRSFVSIEAIINSMTVLERRNPKILNGSRRRRIAMGSGTSVQEINRLLNQFGQMKKMLKNMRRMPRKGMGNVPFNMG
ncbi:MAG: signal recognition particle protein [Calditrichia bacterium]|jgi:signal recognition particle subunit SRP54|nr:signal recognition particle protein [Calditrichia bacterium]